jgi:hypothetical protein
VSILAAGWLFITDWTPQNSIEVAVLSVFCTVYPLGAYWMLYRVVRYEAHLFPYIALSFVPFYFLKYYVERVRPFRGSTVTNYSLVFPEGFDDYAWEVEAKGWCSVAKLSFAGKNYALNFYEPTRLGQEVESELERGSPFFEPNLIVVQSVTRRNMEKAVESLIESGLLGSFVAE